MPRHGGCSDCQNSVLVRRANAAERDAYKLERGYDEDETTEDIDIVEGTAWHWVLESHDGWGGMPCPGTGQSPMAVTNEETP